MLKPSKVARTAMIATAGLLALTAGGAQAQPYYGPAYADPCRQESTNRGFLGALIGAGIGATVGSQISARGHRTDGSVLGGALGALGGAAVGNGTAPCRSGYVDQPYRDAPPPPPPVAAGSGYVPPPGEHEYGRDDYAERIERNRFDQDGGWTYGPRGERFRVVEETRVGPDGCTLAESPVYMPDGSTQMRYVRVCPDRRGRYQVVN